ncbi:MAG: hypothetical protein ACXW1Z_12975 [Methylobacter sp.]
MRDFEDINPLWRLADPLTVLQAAALIAGVDPNVVRFNIHGGVYFEYETGMTDSNGGGRVQTAYEALKNAANAGKLKAKIIHDSRPITDSDQQSLIDMSECGEYYNPGYEHLSGDDEHFSNGYFVTNHPNWEKSLIEVDELRAWLAHKGYRTDFFFPDSNDAPDYLDPKNPRYSPRMAAAVRAWLAMEDENLRRGKSAKSGMEQWLTSNYKTLGLVHKRDNEKNSYKAGDMNKSAITEAAKIANWEDDGGAPKTL